MDEEQTAHETWYEVGNQFRVLGESLAQAFRTAWEDEGNRQQLRDMQSGLEAMIGEIGQAMREVGASPEGQQARREAEKAVESARAAGNKALREIRPHLLSALRQVDQELQEMIGRMEEE